VTAKHVLVIGAGPYGLSVSANLRALGVDHLIVGRAMDSWRAHMRPKTLRYKILHAAARITGGARRRQLRIRATWAWAADIVTAWQRISAVAHVP
jgi:cation diffusion facilitator CzcD-associated flavoprotein CzcO